VKNFQRKARSGFGISGRKNKKFTQYMVVRKLETIDLFFFFFFTCSSPLHMYFTTENFSPETPNPDLGITKK
jgi:hypothetical protein